MDHVVAKQSKSQHLRITEVFLSLQGESNTVGLPTVFVRLTGCPLRCNYCDTEYAFRGGEQVEIPQLLEQIIGYQVHHVTVTGGEPLAQSACLDLLRALCDAGHQVSLETSGALDIASVDSRVIKVVDLKTPGSGEVEKNYYANLDHLSMNDQIKFVICDRDDYEWAKQQMHQYDLNSRCQLLFSPSFNEQNAAQLASWILEDRLPVRFQLQLHKILWGDEPGR